MKRTAAPETEAEGPREYCGDCDGVGWVEGGEALQTTCRRCGGDGWEPRPMITDRPAPGPAGDRAVSDDLERLRVALWQCGVESGMDTDGDAGPGAMVAGMGDAGFAAAMVEQVRQLRRDYDECLAEPELCPDCVGTGYVRHADDFHIRTSAAQLRKGTPA